jgi:hypothetical protein
MVSFCILGSKHVLQLPYNPSLGEAQDALLGVQKAVKQGFNSFIIEEDT